VPVCSQSAALSKESRWEMMQWSCNIQLQASGEKSEARNTDLIPRWPMTGLRELRSKVFHTVSDLKELLFLPVQIS